MIDKIKKIQTLISEAAQTEKYSWLPQAAAEEILVLVRDNNKTIPKHSVVDIYSTRAEINETKKNKVKGFETLLNNLKVTKCENVAIHRMKDKNSYNYLIFTNANADELIGVLKLTK